MDQLDKIYEQSVYLLPIATFGIGFMGSMHCVGMCGGLVMACTPKASNNISYQLGRLISYSILAIIAGFFGSLLSFDTKDPYLSLIPALMIGGMFIWFGLRSYVGKKIKLPFKLNSKFLNLWSKVLPDKPANVTLKSSFLVGGLSILLPCSFLYGVILALGAFQSPLISFVCIFAFWLGTLPVMVFTPEIVKKIITPFQKRLPLFSSGLMVLIGVTTIGHRIYLSYQASCCH